MGATVSVAGRVAGMLVTVKLGAAVGLGAQPERMRQVRMKKEEKKFDFFMANSPYGKEDIDIL